MTPTRISRRSLAGYLGNHISKEFIGTMGYDDIPWYSYNSGDRRYAPVRTLVEYAVGDALVHPAGDILRYLDSAPRDTLLFWPDYSGYRHDGDWIYYKDKYGQWFACGYERT